jgi:Mg2+ and Co2+ transporter CorA
MPGPRLPGPLNLPGSVKMTHVNTATPAAASATPAAATEPAADLASLPASPLFPPREGITASTAQPGGDGGGGALSIHVWYLDDVLTRAEPKCVPDVAALKRLLPERDLSVPLSVSPMVAGDHFAEMPLRGPHAASAAAPGAPQLAGVTSNARLDTISSASGSQSLPSISLRHSSAHHGGHPAWVSVKAASHSELAEILDCLPIHVLTRRRVLLILCKDVPEDQLSDDPVANAAHEGEQNNESDEEEESDDHINYHSVRDNFLEYFPAHGYAVLCLQAVALPKGESTRRGATPKVELVSHGTQVPNTPVVALAFESTLFTFSLGRFGGEGDVRLIVANHVGSPTAHGARGGMPTSVATIATLSSVLSSPMHTERVAHDAVDSNAVAAFESSTTAAAKGEAEGGNGLAAQGGRDAASITASSLATVAHEGSALPAPLPTNFQPASTSPLTAYGGAAGPRCTDNSAGGASWSNWNAATAISFVCSSLISAIIAYLQQSTRSMLMEADQLDELVLQIAPSRVDQDDMLVRMKSMRHLIAALHVDALQKERVLKQLLLPAMRQTPLAQSTQAIERYQRSLSSVRSTVIKLRKGRDIVNMASMTLISGVSARLVAHCNFMDYLNSVQTQIAVVVMPINVIPGLWATNVKVPWQDSTSKTPFWVLTGVTLGLMLLGLAFPLYKFFIYRTPKPLVPLE